MAGMNGMWRAVLILLGLALAGVGRSAPAHLPQMRPAASAAGAEQTSAGRAIRGAHYPALSPDGKRLCFEYLGDLWTVASAGGTASRLTVHRAYDGWPRWSPDGNWIAFSSNREGNYDVYIVPARGGEARQLTFHSADDYVQDWSPDGSHILFSSARDSRYADLYALAVKDGRVRRVTADRTASRYACYSPDGGTIYYTRGRQEWWRPAYKGSANTEIYSIPAGGGKAARLSQYDGWDAWPQVGGEGRLVYFVSDRGGSSNMWEMTPRGLGAAPVTHFTGPPVRFASISRDGTHIAFEREFELFVDDLRRPIANQEPLRIYAASDARQNDDQRVTLTSGAGSIALSQDGKSFAFAAHGDIWTIPAGGGEATRITKTTASEYKPAWSPDGSQLLYSSDRNGNLDIYLQDVKTRVERQITSDSADEDYAAFSPNGRLLAFIRAGGSAPGLYVVPVPQKADDKLGELSRVGPGAGIGTFDWSPDSRWLVYSRRDNTGTTDLWIVPSVGGTPINVTRYPGTNVAPQWSRDGRQIVFLSSRNEQAGGPLNVYAVRLMPQPPRDDEAASPDRDAASPGVQEPEVQRRRQPPSGTPQGAPPAQGAMPGPPIPPRASNVQIDFDDIQNRARAVTNSRDAISGVALSPDSRTVFYFSTTGGQPAWYAADIVAGQSGRITASGDAPAGGVEFAPDGSRFYYTGATGALLQASRGAPAPTPIAFRAVLDIDRRAERQEAFNEAWRLLRTRFYDPKMHGADWPAVRARYEPAVADVTAEEDFAWLLSSMIGELNASHLGATPPRAAGPTVATGQLGLSFDQEYAGPGLKVADVIPRGPADQLGHHVAAGEYVLAIDGQDVVYNEELYKTLRDKVDHAVELLVNEKPSRDGARAVRIRPISKTALDDLEYERWVRNRREKVARLSGGRLAYIHIRQMDQPSLQRFQRELFGEAQSKQGLVLDVRFNPGGRIHDELFALLLRKPHAFETPRDAETSSQPFQVWNRPIILLQNEYSSSDAEIFPNGFREYGLGKIVGVPTYGGVIGTTNVTLVDGTTFRIPRTGWTTVSGKNLENWGVPPDIRVEMTPEDYATDNDKQLAAAVTELLAEMARGRPNAQRCNCSVFVRIARLR